MEWVEISVYTSQEAVEAVSHHFHERGAGGVVIEDAAVLKRQWENRYGEIIALSEDDYPREGVIIKAYLPEMETQKMDALLAEIEKDVQQLNQYGINPGEARVEGRRVAEESWANQWKAYYQPVRISERLTVKPIWEECTPISEQEKIIQLDPGMAFGTGTHPSTLLAIQLLETYLTPGMKVIDVGCGSGILSIATVHLGARKGLALDLDPIAVKNAKENVKQNKMEGVITVQEGDLLRGVSQTAECVVANLLAEIIVDFTYELPRVLVPNGVFIASGIVKGKEERVIDSLQMAGLELLETIGQEGWVAIAAKKW